MSDQEKKIEDNCPAWAHEQLLKLRAIEINLGNIPRHNDYFRVDLNPIYQKVMESEDVANADNQFADMLFSKVVRHLAKEGEKHEDIVVYVNNRVGYEGGPPYCNLEEVREAVTGTGT